MLSRPFYLDVTEVLGTISIVWIIVATEWAAHVNHRKLTDFERKISIQNCEDIDLLCQICKGVDLWCHVCIGNSWWKGIAPTVNSTMADQVSLMIVTSGVYLGLYVVTLVQITSTFKLVSTKCILNRSVQHSLVSIGYGIWRLTRVALLTSRPETQHLTWDN